MRIFAYLIALGLFTGSTAANATLTYDLSPIEVTGTQTVSIYQTGCGIIGLCSAVTSPATSFFSGPLNVVSALNGVLTLNGFNPGSRIDGTVTLTFSGSSLVSSSFTGFSFLMNGSCPSNCNLREASYTAANFSIGVFDSVTRERSVLQPVPEPTTWAMMLMGFGAIGFAMRRRTKLPSATLA